MDSKENLIGKKVFILLKNERVYNGIIKNIEGDLIYLLDKFNSQVVINLNEISSMEVRE